MLFNMFHIPTKSLTLYQTDNRTFMAGIYIHIPFCKQRCVYCDFYSTTHQEKEDRYIEAVCTELEWRRQTLSDQIHTIYIGGGTPSLLRPQSIEQLRKTIYQCYTIASEPEFTIEANPDDITPEWLEAMKSIGINRISMGIQSFHDSMLKLIRRRHNSEKAIEAVQLCQKHGFKNISIDLIYGLPGQTLEDWQADVRQAIDLNVQHISAYALIYEEGTLLWQWRKQKKVYEADEELSLAMFEYLITQLKENGFEHYEISNFGKPGFHSRHNSSYWNNIPYLGCGAAAHSLIGTERMYNVANLNQYIDLMNQHDKGCLNYKDVCHCEELTFHERYNDRIITSLRTAAGLNLKELETDFGTDLKNYCLKMAAPHLNEKTLQITDTDCYPQGVLKLTHQGIFLSDGIMSDLLWVK